jgi:hypothetical protein
MENLLLTKKLKERLLVEKSDNELTCQLFGETILDLHKDLEKEKSDELEMVGIKKNRLYKQKKEEINKKIKNTFNSRKKEYIFDNVELDEYCELEDKLIKK